MPPDPETPALRLRDVSKSYDGGQSFAVEKISLDVPRGELVALLGGSGCGKTTTLKMINRLIDPTSGNIEVDGRDNLASDPIALRRSIGYVFQGVGLFPHLTVGQNVGITPQLVGWEAGRIKARVDTLLEMVHLSPAEFRDRKPTELSGGQQQRVGFARALAAEPSLILLDEAFGALDPITRDSLQQEFLEIQRQLGFTAVLVTHDMTEAILLADRIVVMETGGIVQVGTPRELLAHPATDYVERLVATPRHQAGRVDELLTAADS